MNTTRIIEKLSYIQFKDKISQHKNNIVIGGHALARLSDAQRKVFKDEDLIRPLTQEKPSLTGLQKNGYYVAYFNRKKGYLKIIFNVKQTNIDIVTFMNTDTDPNIR